MSSALRLRIEGTGLQVIETLLAKLHNQRGLTTLEPRFHLAMLTLTFVTSPRRLSMPRRRTTTDTLSVMNGALVVGEAAKNGCVSNLRSLRLNI